MNHRNNLTKELIVKNYQLCSYKVNYFGMVADAEKSVVLKQQYGWGYVKSRT